MKLKSTLLAAAAMIVVSPSAFAYEGLYGAIGAGVNYIDREVDLSTDSVATPPAAIFDSSVDYDLGIGIYTALGYAWGNGFRTEAEFSYRNNSVQQIDPDGGFSGVLPGQITSGSETTVFGGLVNLLYDFENVSEYVTPYLGAGIGFAVVDHDIAGANPAITIAYDGGTETALAYQGIAGVAVELAEGLALDLSYRYFAANPKSTVFASTINGSPQLIKAEHESHTGFVGLRWNFGPSAAPAVQYKDCWDGSSVPVTAECPPQIVESQQAILDPIAFVVYFDYDKSNLTPQAATLVQEAASRALANDIETVVVEGHTDTSGGSAYNEALSQRRAAAVQDALIANGVPADRIRVESYGENQPAKPTADGVREPLNRRSEVTISFQ